MNELIPGSVDFLKEMDRYRRAKRRKRLTTGLIFWALATGLAYLLAQYLGYDPVRIGAAVLGAGLLITIVREGVASRKYRMPD